MWLKSKVCFILLTCCVEIESLVILGGLLQLIQEEVHFESILIVQNSKDQCWQDLRYNAPVFNFNDRQRFYLRASFNKRMLALLCLNGNKDNELKEALYENLQDMRNTPTVIVVKSHLNMSNLFQEFRSQRMLNVLALNLSEGNQTLDYVYSYRAFPRFQVIERRLRHLPVLFETQVKDLHGYTLIAMPDNVSPRAVIYTDASGRREVMGNLAYLFRSFARSLNASLQFCCLMQEEVYDDEVLSSLMNNGSVDLSISLTSPSFDRFEIKNSKTVEIAKWFLMLPVEPFVHRSNFYVTWNGFPFLLIVSILLALLLSNAERLELGLNPSFLLFHYLGDHVLRGMLSQSIVLPPHLSLKRLFIYCVLLFSGLLLCNIYLARLDAFFIHPPTAKRIATYEDFRRAHLKIFITPHDYDLLEEALDEQMLKQIADIFVMTDSVNYFQSMRNELNTSYAYPVTTTLWPLLVEKQAKLDRPIFRESTEMTFLSLLLLAVPLPRNSIFEQVFNSFVSLTHSSGLYTYWLRRTFADLIVIGKMKYHDSEEYQSYRDLNLADLLWFWLLYLVGTALSVIAFIVERVLRKYETR